MDQLPDGLRLRHGVGAPAHHDGVHPHHHEDLEPLGILSGGWVPIAVAAGKTRARGSSPLVVGITPRATPPPIRKQRFLQSVADHALLIAASAAFMLPFVFVLLTSVMTGAQSLTPKFWPQPFRWVNFVDVFRDIPLFRY